MRNIYNSEEIKPVSYTSFIDRVMSHSMFEEAAEFSNHTKLKDLKEPKVIKP